jgi:hypothetical protein
VCVCVCVCVYIHTQIIKIIILYAGLIEFVIMNNYVKALLCGIAC